MRTRTLITVAAAATLVATSATAVDEGTWMYTVPDAIEADEPFTLEIALSVTEPTFDEQLPVGYRHFLLDRDGTPQTGVEVAWARGDDTGTATIDRDGAFLVPGQPFTRGATPALGTVAGDQQALELTLPAGEYFLFSDLADRSPATVRVFGNDRYATAAAAARREFPAGVEVVYLASGESFADALAAGPLAAHHSSPLLLTGPTTLPQPTRDELRRLDPAEIVVVGGSAAVSEEVERELAPYAGDVRRIAGIDREDTAARVAREGWFESTVAAAYIANGRSAPDALGAAARAALADVPVLLTRRDEVPEATAVTLDVLGVEQVTVAGGSAVVSPTTFNALRDQVGAATRRSGPDRYATSAALADRDGSGRTLLVTTGEDFPDALAAGSLARRLDADLLLTRPTTVPDRIHDRAAELAPRRIVALGGTSALAANVLNIFDRLRTPLTPLFLEQVVDDDVVSFQVGPDEPTETEQPTDESAEDPVP